MEGGKRGGGKGLRGGSEGVDVRSRKGKWRGGWG